MNGWKFLSSEQDEKSIASARSNVEQNGLQHLITIRKVGMDSGLKELLDGNGGSYDFCMCNPPFFGSQQEADGEFQRDGRSEPHATPTASATESITWGGEFCFVNRLIEDSLQLQNIVRVYTTMIGKKVNLAALKDELRNHKVPNISSTEFCQGKTMRWGLAWSFDPNFTFPKSYYKEEKKKKAKPPPAIRVPIEIAIEFKTFCIHIIEILEELKINFVEVKQNKWILIMALIVTENTWSNQRRRKRQMLRESAQSTGDPGNMDTASSTEKPESLKSAETDSANQMETSVSESSETGSANPAEMSSLDPDISSSSQSSVSSEKLTLCSENSKRNGNKIHADSQEPKSPNDQQFTLSSRKHRREDDDSELTNVEHHPKKARVEAVERIDLDTNSIRNPVEEDNLKGDEDDSPLSSPLANKVHLQEKTMEETTPYLFKCNLSLRRNQTYILLELAWLDGENRELMQQLLQYFRNKLLP